MLNANIVNIYDPNRLSQEQVSFIKTQSANLLIEMTVSKTLRHVIKTNLFPFMEANPNLFTSYLYKFGAQALIFYGIKASIELRSQFLKRIADCNVTWDKKVSNIQGWIRRADENCRLIQLDANIFLQFTWKNLPKLKEELAQHIKISRIDPAALWIMINLKHEYPNATIVPTHLLAEGIAHFLLEGNEEKEDLSEKKEEETNESFNFLDFQE